MKEWVAKLMAFLDKGGFLHSAPEKEPVVTVHEPEHLEEPPVSQPEPEQPAQNGTLVPVGDGAQVMVPAFQQIRNTVVVVPVQKIPEKVLKADFAKPVVAADPAKCNPPVQGWSKNINDCHIAIREAYPKVKMEFEALHPDCELRVDYTYRGPSVQFELFKKGRALQGGHWIVMDPKLVVTEDDGVTKLSHHNTWPAQGGDIYIVQKGKVLWGYAPAEAELYVELGHIWEKRGVISGMTWKYHWKDPDHVQVAYEIV